MGKIISCPTCGHKLAEWIEKQKQFKVRYEEKDRKNSDDIFKLPIRTFCNSKKCFKEHKIISPIQGDIVCGCTEKGRLIATPINGKMGNVWLKIHLPCIRTIDCADARLRCRNKKCEIRLSLVDFMLSGIILPSREEPFTEYGKDGSVFAASLGDFPQENY